MTSLKELRRRWVWLEEVGFAGLLTIGMLVFALGMAFFILGVSINTSPPAPYVSQTDKYLLVGLSSVAMVIGLVFVRAAGKMVGW